LRYPLDVVEANRRRARSQLQSQYSNDNENERIGRRQLDVPHHIRPSNPHLSVPILTHSFRIDVFSSLGINESSFDVGDETTDGSWMGTSVVELEDVCYRRGFSETEAIKTVEKVKQAFESEKER